MHNDSHSPTPQTRRALLRRSAAGVVAASAAGTLLGAAEKAAASESPNRVTSFIATQEGFGVTFLTEAIRRAPGTPSAQFLDVLKAAVTAEFDHLQALERTGADRQVSRYWIPNAAFGGGGPALFASIEKVETIEVSLYQVGVTVAVRQGDAFLGRLCAAALGTEAEHRVLARAAQNMLGKPVGVPNNVGFEPFKQRSATAAKSALEGLGIGYGRRGATPGRFYAYPGDPARNGITAPLLTRTPR